jgi:hypothetical protein
LIRGCGIPNGSGARKNAARNIRSRAKRDARSVRIGIDSLPSSALKRLQMVHKIKKPEVVCFRPEPKID